VCKLYQALTFSGSETDTGRSYWSTEEGCLWTKVRLLINPPPQSNTLDTCTHTPLIHSDPYVKVTFVGENQVIAHSGHKTLVIKKVSPLPLSIASPSLFSIILLFSCRPFILDGTKHCIFGYVYSRLANPSAVDIWISYKISRDF
jgi:hypothetical protein